MEQEASRNGPTLQLGVELERRVDEIARANAMTPIDVIREAVEEFAAHRGHGPGSTGGETLYDRLMRAGVIGCIDDDGPADLSTNKAHFEGFGSD